MSATDEPFPSSHTADECHFEQCGYCGCCAHGKPLAKGCKVADAPYPMECPEPLCGCEGLS